MNRQNIILLIFSLLFLILFYLHFRKKESFEGIAGSSFVSRVPKGTIVAYYPPDGNIKSIPAGWVACDGEATLSGDIKVPDLRGRFISGVDTNNNIGNTDIEISTYDGTRIPYLFSFYTLIYIIKL